MLAHRIRRVLLAVVAALFALPLVFLATASATAPAPGDAGHDVGWPQCGAALPSTGTFGIVEVSDGIAFSGNPCLAAQWQWAAAQPATPALYTTPANPAPASSHYWATSGSRDPALCINSSSTTDPGCAYDYGWHAAADALTRATTVSAAATSSPWWLDVETGNTYNGNGTSNAADLQGMVDYLRQQGVPSVGFYSTGYQWGVITGGWTTANDASYRQAWAAEFTPLYPMSASPTWVAGASSLSGAQANCASSFTGSTTTIAQYPDGGYDGDLACATSAPSPSPSPTSTPTPTPTPTPTATAPGAPTALSAATATSGSGIALGWSAPASTGGSPVTSYTVYRGNSSGTESAYATVSCSSSASCTTFRDTKAHSGRRYFYVVTATNAVGTGARSNEATATAR